MTAAAERYAVGSDYGETTVNERQMLEDLLKDAEAVVAKIKARLADQLPADSSIDVDASASTAIERVQSQKTTDDPGNW